MRVYSYIRFSSPAQAAGTSVDRQLGYARDWAGKHGLELDTTLSLRDEGLSAYHQKHVKQGALGVFLEAVNNGQVPEGSVLIVEGLDRLSRAKPLQAQAQLAGIINAGIRVVTASDGKEYSSASLAAQPMDLLYALLVMIRANEESETKSRRVKSALARNCEKWLAGQRGQRLRAGHDPSWVTWSDTAQQFVFVPERVAAVRYVVKRHLDGAGQKRIVDEMNERGLELYEGPYMSKQLGRMLKMPALVGTKVVKVQGGEYVLPGYYPAVLTEQEFAAIQAAGKVQGRRQGKGVPGILTGQQLTYCNYCSRLMNGQLNYGKMKDSGRVPAGCRRMMCSSYISSTPCEHSSTVSVVPFERAVVEWCSDSMNLLSMVADDSRSNEIREQLTHAQLKRHGLQEQQQKMADLLLEDGGSTPGVILQRLRKLEEDEGELKRAIEKMQHDLAALAAAEKPEQGELWAELKEAAIDDLNYDARLKIKQMVKNTFREIRVSHKGIPAEDASPMILQLIGHSGKSQRILIDKETWNWREG